MSAGSCGGPLDDHRAPIDRFVCYVMQHRKSEKVQKKVSQHGIKCRYRNLIVTGIMFFGKRLFDRRIASQVMLPVGVWPAVDP